jgi:hypothetical protein
MHRRFAKAIFSAWGSKVTGALSAPFFVASFLTSGVYRVVNACFAIGCVYGAAYSVCKREHSRYVALAERIKGFPLLQVPQDGLFIQPMDFSFGHGVSTLRLNLVNSPIAPTTEAAATGVRADLAFYTSKGERLFRLDGRWADSPQPAERDRAQDIVTTLLAVDFPIGQTRPLDIAFKAPRDACYAVNNDNFAPGVLDPRLPQRRLPEGNIVTKVRVRGVQVDCSINLTFINDAEQLRIVDYTWRNNLKLPDDLREE